MKNGILLLNSSRTAEGATYSRAPSALEQYIPPFSLWWIGMVHDYWMYVGDPAFVKQMMPGVEAVLSFYSRYQRADASLSKMPWWNFVDWVKEWNNGEPPAEADGLSSAVLEIQLLFGYRWAADIERAFRSSALVAEYESRADRLKANILQRDWDAAKGLFADQPSHCTYSQQVNALAVLAHIAPPAREQAIVEPTIDDRSLASVSIYFRAYLNSTLCEVGLGGRYLDAAAVARHVGEWLDNLVRNKRNGFALRLSRLGRESKL